MPCDNRGGNVLTLNEFARKIEFRSYFPCDDVDWSFWIAKGLNIKSFIVTGQMLKKRIGNKHS